LTGAEARAAKLFSQVEPPAEVSPETEAKHLALLRGDARAPRRFRLSTPAAIAVLFGGSMAFAATQPAVRAWVQEKLEVVGVLQPAARPKAMVGPRGPAALVAPVTPGEEEVVVLEEIGVRVDAGPALAVAAPVPMVKPAAPRLAPAAVGKPRAMAPAAPASPVAAAAPVAPESPVTAETPPIPEVADPPATGGVLSQPDIPDMRGMSTEKKIEVYLRRGDLDEAEELTQTMAGDFSDRMTLLRGELLHERKRCKEAIVYFTGVIDTPGVADALLERALYGRAVCYASIGDGAASHADIDRHVGKFPNGRFKSADEKLHRR
jgi:hypothetical protein